MEEIAYYDPLKMKLPKGAVVKGTDVKFYVCTKANAGVKNVVLMLHDDFHSDYLYIQPNTKESFFGKFNKNLYGKEFDIDRYEFSAKFETKGHFWYNFKLETEFGDRFLSKTYSNFSCVLTEKGEDFFQLVTDENYATPGDILEGGVIYQIMVDRFCKVGEPKVRKPLIYRKDWGGDICKDTTDPIKINQQVFGGNFKGVISKLDYLQELGVTAIYLNPVCQADSHHKYDTADYMHFDEMFGTDEDFKKLTSEAKHRGIKVFVDGVYNHTGSSSIYFNKEKYYGDGGAYNDPKSPYHDWYEWVNYPDEYNCWWGIDTLPNVRDDNESFRKYITGENGVIDKYMKLGACGVRLDVADEISDEFLKLVSNRVKKNNPNGLVMGEVWEDAATKISYSKRREYFSNNELNSVMNYPVKESILSFIKTQEPFDFVSTTRMLQNNYPEKVQHNLMNFLGTHDTGRIMSELECIAGGDKTLAIKFLKIAAGLAFTVTGVPSIFYGDEYGMENSDGNARGCFDWNNTGFEITSIFKKLAEIRKLEVFKNGDMNILEASNGKLIFERINKTQRVVVLTNMREDSLKVDLNGNFVSLLSEKKYEKGSSFKLNYLGFEILKEEK